ncbi:MAG TPA: SPOR domain-containing protein [Vicinamibacterales bacterium]|nr:SPOR domain-containing protein [Vicinamibacterales bacterium]
MSDQDFHEVQLSGKQLVFLFMSAVVVMVVVFLLGVNVGRGVRSAVGDTEVLAQSDPGVPKGPDAAGGNAAGADPAKPAQAELSYHDMLLGATPPADKGAAAVADKTPPTEAPPPVAEAPPPAQTPVPTPIATPTPAARPPATQTAPVQPTTAAPKPSGSQWFLQTGAYSTEAVADGQVAKLKQLNVPAFVLPPERSGTKLFHVRVGPYGDRAEAERVSSRISRQGFPSSITR